MANIHLPNDFGLPKQAPPLHDLPSLPAPAWAVGAEKGAEQAVENLECPPGVDCTSMAQSFWQSDKVHGGVCREQPLAIASGLLGVCKFGDCGKADEKAAFCLGTDAAVGAKALYRVCPHGWYCPNNGSAIRCPKGFFCPSGSSQPNPCSLPPEVHSTQGLYCGPGSSGLGSWCPAGFYCPTPSDKILCPAHYFCPAGHIEPRRCPWYGDCQQGAEDAASQPMIFVTLSVILSFCSLVMMVFHWFGTKDQNITAAKVLALKAEKELLKHVLSVTDLVGGEHDTRMSEFPHRIGTQYIRFTDMGFQWENRILLENVSGEFWPGSMCAIMGPSGSGKTTFINRIMGRLSGGRQRGRVWIDDKRCASLRSLQDCIGFVPQDDVMHTNLTVRQVLTYQCRLRNRLHLTHSEKEQFIDNLLLLLQIENVQHSLIGHPGKRGISGGQRKRVNIGMELAAYPSIIFLDEPTSGLDATSTQVICRVLKEISQKNVTIVAVIHQPRWSVFRIFDICLILQEGGKEVYFGATSKSTEYFESLGYDLPKNENPADWYIDILSGTLQHKTKGAMNFQEEWSFYQKSQVVKPFQVNPLYHDANERNLHYIRDSHFHVSSIKKEPGQKPKGKIRRDSRQLSEDLHYAMDDIFEFKNVLTRAEFRTSIYRKFSNDYTPEVVDLLYDQLSQGKGDGVSRKKVEERLRSNLPLVESEQDALELETSYNLICPSHFALFFQRGVHQISLVQFASRTVAMAAVAFLEGAVHKRALPTDVGRRLEYIQLDYMQSFAVSATLIATFSVQYFGSEKVIAKRERDIGVSVLGYWAARHLLSFLIDVCFLSTVFCSVYYIITMPFTPYHHVLSLFFMNSAVGNSFGLFLGQMMNTTLATTLALIAPLVLGLMFSGCPNLSNMNSFELSVATMSPVRYVLESMVVYETIQEPVYLQDNVLNKKIEEIGYDIDPFAHNTRVLLYFFLFLKCCSLLVIIPSQPWRPCDRCKRRRDDDDFDWQEYAIRDSMPAGVKARQSLTGASERPDANSQRSSALYSPRKSRSSLPSYRMSLLNRQRDV